MKRNVGKLSARAAGLVIAFVAAVVAVVPNVAHSHGGGLDGLGCHHNRKAGGYHCHQGALAGQSFGSKVEAEPRATRGASTATGDAGPISANPVRDGDRRPGFRDRWRFP